MQDQFLAIINQSIEANLDNENFSVEDLARSAGLSRSMLHRKLIKLTGQSASELITRKRLVKARELLENDVATASEIAYRVGFNSPSYFNTVFKKYYKISPGSVRKTLESDPDYFRAFEKSEIQEMGKDRRRKIQIRAFIIAIITGFIIGGTISLMKMSKQSEKSLAVLPLHNLTGQEENVYFVDGIHDALIGELGQIGSLRVISRTSTLRYRNTDLLLEDIAKELNVNTIVEGSVIGAGDSLKLLIQLIDVFPKERHLLAREYHEAMPKVLTVQTAVAKDIAQKIRIKLTEDEELLLGEKREVDPETYKAYLRGMYYLNQGTPEAFEEGIKYFYEAIERDPGDPFAYAAMALGYAHIGHGQVDYREAFNRLESAAAKALKLDPESDEAHTALAIHHLYNKWDWPFIEESFETALRKNPNNEIAHAHYAWYWVMFNNMEKSLYHSTQAIQMEPFSASYTSWHALLMWYNHDYDKAEYWAKRSLELKEDSPYGNLVLCWIYIKTKQFDKALELTRTMPVYNDYWKMLLGYNYVRCGQRDKALAFWKEFEEDAKKHWVNNCYRGMMATYLGFDDEAFRYLNEAVEYKLYPITYINFYPMVEDLRDDPRYNELLQKMNLPYSHTLYSSNQ